jgi:hypothetical protein
MKKLRIVLAATLVSISLVGCRHNPCIDYDDDPTSPCNEGRWQAPWE